VAGRLNKGIHGLFKKYKVEHLAGTAALTGTTGIDVAGKDGVRKIQAKSIVIATGARSKFLPDLKPDGKVVITSREAMVLSKVPKHLLIVGAGPIGIEFAYFYSAFGCKVTVIEFQETILPSSDRELSALLAKSLARRGIEFLTGAKLDKVQVSGSAIKATVVSAKDSKLVKAIDADVCLSAVGMTGNIEEIGLEKAGIKTDRGFIKVDDHCRTSVNTIYAIGDVTGPPLLAHTASYQGHGVAEMIVGKQHEPMNKDQVPGCTYCHPQLASVGLTEEQCKERKIDYTVGRFPFAASGMAIAAGDEEGLVKLLFGKKHGELLGAHVLAGHASDLIAELGLAMRVECTYEEILATIHAHPTLSESIQEASGQAFGQAVHI
jgi:dihydrolipoamide dehydrogenase